MGARSDGPSWGLPEGAGRIRRAHALPPMRVTQKKAGACVPAPGSAASGPRSLRLAVRLLPFLPQAGADEVPDAAERVHDRPGVKGRRPYGKSQPASRTRMQALSCPLRCCNPLARSPMEAEDSGPGRWILQGHASGSPRVRSHRGKSSEDATVTGFSPFRSLSFPVA